MTLSTETEQQIRKCFVQYKLKGWSDLMDYSLKEDSDAIEILKAKIFITDTKRNAWVLEDMKRNIENHITRLCDIIESQKMHIESITNEHLKMRFECGVEKELLSKVKELKMGFERIDTTPTMSELTRQCIEAYNTCSEIQRKLLEMDKPKTKGKTE